MSDHVDHFQRLGLPRRFSVDRMTLEREYLARSRLVHPDFHSGDDDKTAETAKLNDAYITLKDPIRRAEYLLGQWGGPSARDEKNLDQAFLMEMMDVRERIEDINHDPERSAAIELELTRRYDFTLDRVATLIDGASSASPDRTTLVKIRRELNGIRTIQSLMRSLVDEPEL